MHRELTKASGTLISIGYDRAWHALQLEFRQTGDIYLYFDVPPEEHAEFMAASSKGTYLNHVFKSKGHRYRLVKRGPGSHAA